ncbi:hypothetical protein BUALT_Bualt16G0126300 [Buddleja alternifolia]|uniref:E3 ubiquitin-protein ligase RMA n=1 Tax=Buddleja alternifolia TaxID=168488 RepID=A0AAV6WJE5_9LAMI|nr:hypothetical protein BUALT_Bualt16G0126300 [Buddleja alternifolia]
MEEENTNTMNLDLNLGPLDNSSDDNEPASGSYPNVAMNLEDWLDGPVHRVREVRQRNHRWRSLWRQVPIPPETRNLALELIVGNSPQTGEGSVVPEERPIEVAKVCENGNGKVEDEGLGKKKENGINNGDEGSFFDCNICLDLSKDPVVTCCGHLFCWPCLYQWLHYHSDAKECPVCKGEVTTKNITPIYGRGNNSSMRDPDVDSSLKIPIRPQARRVESWRQTIQRTAFTIPMEEMIRRLGSTFDLSRELAQIQNGGGPHESPERSNSLLNRILSSRAMRRERAPSVPSDHVIDLTESSPARENRRMSSLLLRRSNSHRAATLSNLTSAMNNSAESLAAERLVESYFHNNPVERNHELPPPVDDRDSVSSIAAVIHSESQTVDNAIEIDSTVSFSTSSSRRRNDASRISDVDSGDSRAPRRRRLN